MQNNMKTFTQRTVRIRTKNPTSNPLRKAILVPFKALCRLGSRTPTSEVFPGRDRIIECNTVEAIENSRDKLRMKECFRQAGVTQAEWYIWKESNLFTNILNNQDISIEELLQLLPSGIVMKRRFGFQGKGMFLIRTMEDWNNFKIEAKKVYKNLELS